MNKFLLLFYKFSPKLFAKMIANNPIFSIKFSNYLFSLIKKKDLYTILPYLDLEFLKILQINLKTFSYFLFEHNFSENETKNKILLKICVQLIDHQNFNNHQKLEYFLDGTPNWLYSLVDLSTSNTHLGEIAHTHLLQELQKENSFLTEDVIQCMQLSYLVDKHVYKISYSCFMLVYWNEANQK